MPPPLILAHGGVGSPVGLEDGTRQAAEAGGALLRRGGSAVDAVVAATRVLEDDPRFNAGTGSRIRIGGRVEMDAGIMASDGSIGAVAAIQHVRNPVLVARRVMDTPHVLLVGDGALRFARRSGFAAYDPRTPGSRQKLRETLERVRAGRLPGEQRRHAGFWVRAADLTGTVGAVARDRRGRFAACNSTGGTSIMLPGRVGDTPIPGAGIFAGPQGAVACTGTGEEIIRRVAARIVYDQAAGRSFGRAGRRMLASVPGPVPVGIIGVGPRGWGLAANREMAATLIAGSKVLSGASLLDAAGGVVRRAGPRSRHATR